MDMDKQLLFFTVLLINDMDYYLFTSLQWKFSLMTLPHNSNTLGFPKNKV